MNPPNTSIRRPDSIHNRSGLRCSGLGGMPASSTDSSPRLGFLRRRIDAAQRQQFGRGLQNPRIATVQGREPQVHAGFLPQVVHVARDEREVERGPGDHALQARDPRGLRAEPAHHLAQVAVRMGASRRLGPLERRLGQPVNGLKRKPLADVLGVAVGHPEHLTRHVGGDANATATHVGWLGRVRCIGVLGRRICRQEDLAHDRRLTASARHHPIRMSTPAAQWLCRPPLTSSVWPVTKLLSLDTRKATAPSRSSGVPRRPSGVRPTS